MGVSGGAIRAGRAFVELFADDTKLIRALNSAKARVQAFAASTLSIGAKSGAAGSAIAAPLGKAFSDAMSKGANIKRIAIETGETTETISKLAGAFSIAGANIEEFDSTLDGLRGRIKGAADANTQLVDGLHGLNGRFLISKGMDQQLDLIAERFKTIDLASDRAAVAQGLFGASGLKLLPYLREGAAGIAKLKAEGAKAGEIMSADDIESAYQASKSLNLIWLELKNTVVAVGSALLPATSATKGATEQIREAFAAARGWISENAAMIVGLAKLGAGLIAGGIALAGIAAVFSKLAMGIGMVAGLVKLVAAGFLALLSPVGAVIGVVVGLGAVFLTQTETGRKMVSDLSAGFVSMGQTFSESWGGIVDAVKKGDLQGAFAIVGAGIKTVWSQLMLTLRKGWNDFMKWTVDALRANPWILPLIGGIVGGLTAGPGGAVVGAGAGAAGALALEAFGDKVTDALTADTAGAEARVKQHQDELRALVAKAKEPGRSDGKEIDAAALDKARFDAYAAKIKDTKDELPFVGSSTKGVFAGPIGQQLGYADETAKRQLAATQNVEKAVNKVVAVEEDYAKTMERWLNECRWK